jgi:predicted TIM-barrel fold metal-dependent hydrolase
MLQGMPVVDAVVHTFNFSPENELGPVTEEFTRNNYAFHQAFSDPSYVLTEAEFRHEWTVDELADLVFVESGIDAAIYQALPLTDFYKDGLSSIERGVEWARRFPDRSRWYATVNPFDGDRAFAALDYQVQELGAVGLKFYPARYVNGRTLSMSLNDQALTVPLIRRAAELGVKTISIHKFMPFGPVPTGPFAPYDLDEACTDFPDLNFEVVHVGWSLIEDSCSQLARHNNMYANLEGVFNLIVKQPRRFAEILGQLLFWGGPDRLLYSSGASLVHPRPALEAFMAFEMPRDLVEGFGYPEVTDEIKAMILGGNMARLHGIDLSRIADGTLHDEVEERRQVARPNAPWQALRA